MGLPGLEEKCCQGLMSTMELMTANSLCVSMTRNGFYDLQSLGSQLNAQISFFSPPYMLRLLGRQAGFWSVFPGFPLGAIKWQVKHDGGWAMHSTMFCLLPHCDNLCFAGMFCETEGRKHVL